MNSLRGKIFWSFVGMAFIASLSAMGVTALLLLKQSEREAKQRILAEEKNLLSLGVMDFISLVEYRQFIDQISTSIPSGQLSEVIRIYIPPGRILYSNQTKMALSVPQQLILHVDRGFYEIAQGSREYLASLRSYKTSDGKILWLEIATPQTSPWTALKGSATLFAISLLGLIGLGFFFSFWLGRKISSPIELFAHDLTRLDPKNIKTWKSIPVRYEEILEMKPIVKSFNMLKDRLQLTFIRNEYLGRFIAHEIRTPLTIIQGEIELSTGSREISAEEAALRKSILEEVNKISGVVETVLKIPYGDKNSIPIQIEKTDLAVLLKQITEELQKSHHPDIELQDELPSHLLIDTDPYLFSMLLGNLVRNAHQHGSTNASIRIKSYQVQKKVFIEVVDHGKGLSPEVLHAANSEDVFSKDLGIGLILSKQIAELLRHEIKFENPSNGGLRVTIVASIFE